MTAAFDFVRAYPYFFANLPILAAVILIPRLARNRDYARTVVFSGLACLPCSLAEITSGEYWHPQLMGGWRCGVEDLIFTYAFGAAAWLSATLWIRERFDAATPSLGAAFLRLTPWALSTVTAGMALWLAGMQHMTALLISSSGLLIFLLLRRPSLARLALAGLVSFMPFYVFAVKLEFAAWPNYPSYWNTAVPWGTLVLGIPCGEIAWAAVFGAAWPVIVASALDVRDSQACTARALEQARVGE